MNSTPPEAPSTNLAAELAERAGTAAVGRCASTDPSPLTRSRTVGGRIQGAKWHGRPCKAEPGTVIVGKVMAPTWWCADLVGTRIRVLRVTFEGKAFYLEDRDGRATEKVLAGGGPWSGRGHASVPVDDPTSFEADGADGRDTRRNG